MTDFRPPVGNGDIGQNGDTLGLTAISRQTGRNVDGQDWRRGIIDQGDGGLIKPFDLTAETGAQKGVHQQIGTLEEGNLFQQGFLSGYFPHRHG